VASGYLAGMLARRVRTDGFIEPFIPTLAAKPPSGPGWVHEIKHGHRLIVRRAGAGCSSRWPLVMLSNLLKNRSVERQVNVVPGQSC